MVCRKHTPCSVSLIAGVLLVAGSSSASSSGAAAGSITRFLKPTSGGGSGATDESDVIEVIEHEATTRVQRSKSNATAGGGDAVFAQRRLSLTEAGRSNPRLSDAENEKNAEMNRL